MIQKVYSTYSRRFAREDLNLVKAVARARIVFLGDVMVICGIKHAGQGWQMVKVVMKILTASANTVLENGDEFAKIHNLLLSCI